MIYSERWQQGNQGDRILALYLGPRESGATMVIQIAVPIAVDARLSRKKALRYFEWVKPGRGGDEPV